MVLHWRETIWGNSRSDPPSFFIAVTERADSSEYQWVITWEVFILEEVTVGDYAGGFLGSANLECERISTLMTEQICKLKQHPLGSFTQHVSRKYLLKALQLFENFRVVVVLDPAHIRIGLQLHTRIHPLAIPGQERGISYA